MYMQFGVMAKHRNCKAEPLRGSVALTPPPPTFVIGVSRARSRSVGKW
jgi:hypothetical protein